MAEPVLRVGLAQGRNQARVTLAAPYTVGDQQLPAGTVLEVSGGTEVEVRAGGTLLASGPWVRAAPVDPDGSFLLHGMKVGVDFHWEHDEDLPFRGGVRFGGRPDGVFDVVNEVGLEAYLESVVSSEMSARCPPALLRAHAVISRSWLLAMLEGGTTRQRSATKPHRRDDGVLELVKWYDREDHAYFDVCADDHCQRYQGLGRTSTAEALEAVQQTRGLVLSHDGAVCDARFSKACGGFTEVFRAAWGDLDVPYLLAFSDAVPAWVPPGPLTEEAHAHTFLAGSPPAFCNTSDRALLEKILPALDHGTTTFYRWEHVVTAAEIRTYVREKAGVDLGVVEALVPLARGPSGRLVRLRIIGDQDTLEVGKELEIRKLLSKSHLYSSAFTVTSEGSGEERRFTLRGGGWGHGVGLCQIGAAVMAEQGYGHEAILEHYYRGADLVLRY